MARRARRRLHPVVRLRADAVPDFVLAARRHRRGRPPRTSIERASAESTRRRRGDAPTAATTTLQVTRRRLRGRRHRRRVRPRHRGLVQGRGRRRRGRVARRERGVPSDFEASPTDASRRRLELATSDRGGGSARRARRGPAARRVLDHGPRRRSSTSPRAEGDRRSRPMRPRTLRAEALSSASCPAERSRHRLSRPATGRSRSTSRGGHPADFREEVGATDRARLTRRRSPLRRRSESALFAGRSTRTSTIGPLVARPPRARGLRPCSTRSSAVRGPGGVPLAESAGLADGAGYGASGSRRRAVRRGARDRADRQRRMRSASSSTEPLEPIARTRDAETFVAATDALGGESGFSAYLDARGLAAERRSRSTKAATTPGRQL